MAYWECFCGNVFKQDKCEGVARCPRCGKPSAQIPKPVTVDHNKRKKQKYYDRLPGRLMI